MDFESGLFPVPVLWFAHVVCVCVLLAAVYTAPWNRVRENEQMHVFLGSCVVLMMLWSLKAGILPGLTFHLLGVTALTLMLGWQLAFVAVTLVVIGITWNGAAGWFSASLNIMVMGALPILVTQALLVYVQRRLPHNLFVYIFFNAFLAAGLSMLAVGMCATWLLIISGVYSLASLGYDFLPFLPLISLPEAIINGMLVTVFVVYRPHWVISFNDSTYLSSTQKD